MLQGLFCVLVLWAVVSPAQRVRLERWFARRLMAILRVRVDAVFEVPQAQYAEHGPVLLYSNHVSWIDIFAFNAVAPVTFIAKSEISQWPLAGTLAKRSGTLFIERGRRHAVREVIEAAAKVLGQGRTVAVFPEGTTGTGREPLPFHSNFVQPAIAAGVPLLPVTLQYVEPNGRFTEAPAFVGEQTLLDNIRVLVTAPQGFVCRLTFHAPIDVEGNTRHTLSAQARSVIEARMAEGAYGSMGTPGSCAGT
ncbi:MAG: lysophospholipid acyltransferase family protein [Limnobacter sp.]|uniref:lysophospholipid acyltransferase family protein n=1 Tax=Limnobacter sp. TaxID=2003368 RepID=UPI00391D16BE